MRFAPMLYFVVLGTCIISCKKNTDEPSTDGSNVNSLNQSIFYKIVVTVPSPTDLAKGVLRDSMSVSRTVNRGDKEFFANIPNLDANIGINFPGFSIVYDDPAKDYPCFTFSDYAFPGVPREFAVNKFYENATIPGSDYQEAVFLGYSSGKDGMTFFLDNVFPTDAQFPPLTKTYASIVFNKKIKIPMPPRFIDSALIASGHIVGYCINYYSNTDTLKYKQRWDFWLDFTDLKIDP